MWEIAQALDPPSGKADPSVPRRKRSRAKEVTSMAQTHSGHKRIRKFYGKIREVAEMPNLIEVQKSSYDLFLNSGDQAIAAGRRGHQGRLPVGLSDQGLQRDRDAGVREVRARAPEVRRRRVHAARHDLRRAAEGDAAPDRVRGRRGDRRALGQGHQGAGRLHGRHAPDDAARHLRGERHRARHRVADAPLARACSSTTTRARPTRRASCCSPAASFPTAARGSTSSSTPRTSSTPASTVAGSCR